MKPPDKCAILIVTYRTPEATLGLLDSLAAWAGPTGREVVVVDNAGTDDPADPTSDLIAQRHPWVRLRKNSANVGFGPAVNQAAAMTEAQRLLLLNSDAWIDQESLSRLEAVMDADARIAVTGPMIMDSQGRIEASRRGELTLFNIASEWLGLARLMPGSHRWGDAYKTHTSAHVGQTAEFLKGACLLVRREAFDQVGGMDPLFFFFCDEADLCRRMRATGWRIWYEPSARAKHKGGLSVNRDPLRKERLLQQAMMAYQEKHFGAAARRQVRRIMLAGYWLRAGMQALLGVASAGARAKAVLLARAAAQLIREG